MALTFNQKKYIGIGIALVVVVTITLFYVFRSQPFKMSPMGSGGVVITAEQLESVLNNEGIQSLSIKDELPRLVIETSDPVYELPNESWFTNTFLFDFKRFIAISNKTFFKVNANDCDKFSLFFHSAANLVPRTKQSGVAIGEEGFKMILAEKPDLILLDLILPGIDGFEVLSRVKADETLKDIPIIVLSNLGQREDLGCTQQPSMMISA